MKKILLFAIGMFLITLASALGEIKSGEELDLKVICISSTGYCGATANCNITVVYQNNSPVVTNVQMQNQIFIHNFTLTGQQTTPVGIYDVVGFCNDSTIIEKINFSFEVTYDGLPSDVFSWNFVLIAIAFLFIVFGLQKERYFFFQIVGSIMLLVIGVWTLYPGYSTLSWQNIQGQLLGTVLISLGFYFMIENAFSRKDQADSFEQDFEEDGD